MSQFCYTELIEKKYFCSYLKIISADKLYSSRNPSRSAILLYARSHAGSSNIRNIVILPPDSGNLDTGTVEYPN